MILEVDKTPKIEIRVEITSTHNYNTRSSTKRVKHVTTIKNAPKMFPEEAREKENTHSHRLNLLYRPQKRNNHNEINGKPNPLQNYRNVLVCRDLVNMDEPVWSNSMCNKIGRLS